MPESATARRVRCAEIADALARVYPDAHCELNHRNAFELLIATILSAQCTDKRVNLVTPALFRAYPTPAAMAAAPRPEIERLVQSTGFFRAKARSIQEASADLATLHNGEVPAEMAALIKLRGVGRKTANVVLGNAFGMDSGVVVDTHVARLSKRLGLTKHSDPVKIEQDLIKLVPLSKWTLWSHWLIFHGRRRCDARKPDCARCEITVLCPSAFKVLPNKNNSASARKPLQGSNSAS